jgi:uncharacterized protein YbjT (DUF2867 family)
MLSVIGGRSKSGSALIGELIAKNEADRALVRSGDGNASFPAAVETVTGELADPDCLCSAMAGAGRGFLLRGSTENEVQTGG